MIIIIPFFMIFTVLNVLLRISIVQNNKDWLVTVIKYCSTVWKYIVNNYSLTLIYGIAAKYLCTVSVPELSKIMIWSLTRYMHIIKYISKLLGLIPLNVVLLSLYLSFDIIFCFNSQFYAIILDRQHNYIVLRKKETIYFPLTTIKQVDIHKLYSLTDIILRNEHFYILFYSSDIENMSLG
jgi:hypothetical protein